jgi:hypothetical protein
MVHATILAALAALALCVTSACDGERRLLTSSPAGESFDHETARAKPAASDSTGARAQAEELADRQPASEAVARAILAERFRAAGFRIRHDVAVARPDGFALTVDGYDPQARLGFEYVAVSERDTDLDALERAALESDSEYRILVLDAAPVADIEERAGSFLRSHAGATSDSL